MDFGHGEERTVGNRFPGTKPPENYPFWKLTDTPCFCIFLFLYLDMLLASRLRLRNKILHSILPMHPSLTLCLAWQNEASLPCSKFWVANTWHGFLKKKKKISEKKSALKCIFKNEVGRGKWGSSADSAYLPRIHKALGSTPEQQKLVMVVPIVNPITWKTRRSMSSLTN